jgi:leukotriene-A4 hydrolase
MRSIFLTITMVLSAFNSFSANDLHSFAKPKEAVITNLSLSIEVDMDKQIISGVANYTIEKSANATLIWFDTKQLNIEKVLLNENIKTNFQLSPEKPFLGRGLSVNITAETKTVSIYYSTTKESAALQWLTPEQTEGKNAPFLFTQGQAILTRTWIPIQDSPGIRFSWDAKVKVPPTLLAVMSAQNPKQKNETGEYTFRMVEPVPAYLIALAVGDLHFITLSERTGVYAESDMVGKASDELMEMEQMLVSAEKLYGTYQWGRYDVIVLPPSFPFGGMENPRLTFATPTIIAGDRSLISLVAHELAHSWSGNLVTNATWDDFWLNEGFTVYFERRIMESISGKEYADMLAVLGYQDLLETVVDLGDTSSATKLKLNLTDKDPDDGMSDIAYEKGYFFLQYLENILGRTSFDLFLNEYFKTYAFKTITTEEFLIFLNKKFPGKLDPSQIDEWIYKPGLPKTLNKPVSLRFDLVDQELSRFAEQSIKAEKLITKNWSTHEWIRFIRKLPATLPMNKMIELDNALSFTQSKNAEIQFAWFMQAIQHDYAKADDAIISFLSSIGRRKFVLPLYKALFSNSRTAQLAKDTYVKLKTGYHSVTQQSVDEVFSIK